MAENKHTPNKELSENGSKIKSWKEYKNVFLVTGSKTAYDALQKNYENAIEIYKRMAESAQYKDLLTEVNALNGQEMYALSLEQSVSNYLKEIQNANLWKWIDRTNNMTISSTEGTELVNKLNKIGKYFYGEDWDKGNNNLGILKQLADKIAEAASSNASVELLKCFPTENKEITNVSAARKVQGALNRLRGLYLEQEVTKILINKLPDKTVFNTGAIKVGSKSIKEDIAILEKNFKILNKNGELVYSFNNDGSITDKTGKQVEKIVLEEWQYKELQDEMFAGVSAKTSMSTTVFHGGYNINTLLDEVKENDKIIYQLIHMYQLGIGPRDNVLAYQKYAISKNLLKIIGKKNVFMASRTGIIPTYQYLNDVISGNKQRLLRFRNSALPTRAIENSLNKKFGSTDIIGPSVKK